MLRIFPFLINVIGNGRAGIWIAQTGGKSELLRLAKTKALVAEHC
jgi:hypothetical protein